MSKFASGGGAPADLLARAQQQRPVVQDFCPFPQSIEWELGQRYLSDRGNKAFINDLSPVPFVINNDGKLSTDAATVLFTSLAEADKAGTLERDIFVVELGIGVGLFARLFLDAFRGLCVENGQDYYDRLCYVAGDYSERMLLDASRHGVLAAHPGRYLLRVVDALDPGTGLDKTLAGPVRAVFLNYLLDCLPATALKIRDGGVSQLFVRSCLGRGATLSEHTALTADELRDKMKNGTAAQRSEVYDLFGLLASEYEYRPVDAASVPYAAIAADFARSAGNGYVWHSYGALQCLERCFELVGDAGFILLNDYGHTDVALEGELQHQRFSRSTSVGINFPLLKSFFTGSAKCQWAEPEEDNESIYARLLGHRLGPDTVACFGSRFGKKAWEFTQEPAQLARAALSSGYVEAAATAYKKALERQPNNWMLLSEVAKLLTFSLRNPEAGRDMARAALALNPTCSAAVAADDRDVVAERGDR